MLCHYNNSKHTHYEHNGTNVDIDSHKVVRPFNIMDGMFGIMQP